MMRTNADKNSVESADVYSGLDTSYSSTFFTPDAQEFSLESVQEKLGNFSQVDEADADGVLNADMMPTQQTLTMNYKREYQQNSSVEASQKLTTKTKVAIISYVAVVLALILGITFASVAVSGAFAENIVLTESYQNTMDNVSAMESVLSTEDIEALTQRAAELGYIDANEAQTQTFTRVETRPAQNFEIESNWFDSLCDWLGEVFGG